MPYRLHRASGIKSHRIFARLSGFLCEPSRLKRFTDRVATWPAVNAVIVVFVGITHALRKRVTVSNVNRAVSYFTNANTKVVLTVSADFFPAVDALRQGRIPNFRPALVANLNFDGLSGFHGPELYS